MQTRKDDNAFPVFDNEGLVIKGDDYCWDGLSKREYFAAAALQGLLANSAVTDCEIYPPLDIPGTAVKLADALIFELNNQHD